MLDRQAIQELLRAKVPARQIAKRVKASVRTVRRIGREAAVESGDDAASRDRAGSADAGSRTRCARG